MDNIIEFLNFEDEGLEVLDQKVEKGRRVLTLQKKPTAHFCPVCSHRMHSKGITPRTINHPIMQDGLQVVLIVDQRRWQCTNPACRNIVTDEFSFVEKYKRNTKLADILVVNEFRNPNMTAAAIARKFNVSDTYALTTFSKYVDMHRRQLTEAICIDEVHVDISRVCNYALVIQDFVPGEPIDMVVNRRQEITEPYFTAIPAAERNRVRYLVSDMYRPYIVYVDKYFPNAISVVDSFHVVKHIIHQIQLYMAALARKIRNRDFERHQERERAAHRNLKFVPSREYRLVKHYQWLIVKNQSDLRYSDPPSYQFHLGFYADIHKLEYMLFQIDPNLKDFRRLKERYIRFNNEFGDNPKKARPQLRQLIQDYRFSGFKLFRDIADTLDYHFESIINSFIVIERMCSDGTHISRLSNGPIESLNRIVKDMKRNGRGFRNFEHMRNRFLFANRVNAQMLSVPLPPERYQVKTGIKRGPYEKKNK